MSVDIKSFPNLFEYDNYRTFLKDAYEAMKSRDKKFSFRYFARVAGFNSHNFLRMVMQGESKLSEKSISKISKAFKFNGEETRFFKNLVLLNQASSNEEKQVYAKEILASQTYKKIHPLSESQYQFFNNWYFAVIRDMAGLPNFKDDPEWVAERVFPPIKPNEARRAMDDLLKMGLLKRDETGRLVQAATLLIHHPQVASAYVANWHKESLKKAVDSIDTIPREKRDISTVSFGFPIEKINIVKDMIANFRKELLLVASQQDARTTLLQMNIQLFPTAHTESDGEK